jgi:hypothetical protein
MKGEAPIVGITKLDGVTMEELKRPRRKDVPAELLAAAAKATAPLDRTSAGATSDS